MIIQSLVPPALNSAWNQQVDPHDEEALEQEEANFEEELKIIFTQDINNNYPGIEQKEDEEDDEEDGEEAEDMEEYVEEMQIPEL